jgi:signal transduction histidine kinase/CheY-like chemotaxis protein
MSKHYLSNSSKVVSLRARLPRRRPSTGSKPPTLPVDPLWAEDTIAAMAACIISAPGEMEAQREQLALVQGLTRARSCYLLQKTELTNQLEVVAVRGRNDPRIAAVVPGEGVAGKAFFDGRIVRADGTVAVPLLGAGAVVGCLVLLSPQRVAKDPLLTALASQISAASEVSRLKDEMVRRNRDLQTAVAGLKSLEKNREVMISNISHDLKNPLSTLKVYLNMLGRKNLGELTEKQAKAVSTCERSADRLLRMINDLLLLSRLQSGKMQLDERPFGLKDLVQRVVDTLSGPATVAKVQLALLPCPEVYVRGDRDRLFEALGNLVESAVQRSRGTVQIRVSAQKSGLAIFSVHDNGQPLPADELEHVFELYHRDRVPKRPRPSRNLGLPVASKVVQLHGGKIEIKSSSGSGTTVEVSLPAFAAAVAPASTPVAPRAGSILLVEDDVDCREVLQQVLDQEGYPVVSVADTGAAISILHKSRPAMVLLDLRLSREDGRSVLHHIRENPSLSDVPVYIISGTSEVSWTGSGEGLDRIDGFFEKPINLPKLLGTVSAVVRRPAEFQAAHNRTKS